MSIAFHHDGAIAHLTNGTVSYVMEVLPEGILAHRHFGRAVRSWRGAGVPRPFKRGYATEYAGAEALGEKGASYDDVPYELPVRGSGDFGAPALEVVAASGARMVRPRFAGWRAVPGAPALPGLPCLRGGAGDAETLETTLEDAVAGLRVTLRHTIFAEGGAMVRSCRVENAGVGALRLEGVMSASLELPAADYDVLALFGTHAHEARLERAPLGHATWEIGSSCGSSSPFHQPFFALLEPGAGERAGEVRALHLVYSGNFSARAERDPFGRVRAQIGINPDGFSWELAPGEAFEAPEAVLAWSGSGLGGLSAELHRAYRERLLPAAWAGVERPVLLNSWEAMYCDVSLEKVRAQAVRARELGIELFVLDDGWFRAGSTTHDSMGDWACNQGKLPGGIEAVAAEVHVAGLRFGLWFEPEAVSPDAEVLLAHPDWALRVPGYEPVIGRHELLLDLGRRDVQDHLVSMLSGYLGTGCVDYVKWDMNRPLTDVFSSALAPERQGEAAHRYVLGLYRVLGEVTARFPQVLFEGCSSGGARLDPGMLAFVPQNWASDNTDARDRAEIQEGLSLLYPPECLGAHVSVTPNHQTGRSSSLASRFSVARLFNLGYELDVCALPEGELAEIAAQVTAYKADRAWLARGSYFRGEAPNAGHRAWWVVSEDRTRCLVVLYQELYDALLSRGVVRLAGLDPARDYRVAEGGGTGLEGRVLGGDELMACGLAFPLAQEDFRATCVRLMAEA